MPPAILQQVQSVVVPALGNLVVPHALTNGVARVQPNIVRPDRDTQIAVASADALEVVYTNPDDEPQSANFLVQFDHTIQQATPTGVPLQFYYQGGIAGGGNALLGDESNLWFPPETAHALDDEFNDGAVLDPAWAQGGTPGIFPVVYAPPINNYDPGFLAGSTRASHNTDRPSWFLIQPPANNGEIGFTKPPPAVPNYLVWARTKTATTSSGAASDARNGMAVLSLFEDGDNYVQLRAQFKESGSTLIQFSSEVGNVFGFNNSFTTHQRQQIVEYIALHRVGPLVYGWAASADGSWMSFGFRDMTAGFAPVTVGISFGSNSVSSGVPPGSLVGGFDFFRAEEVASFNL